MSRWWQRLLGEVFSVRSFRLIWTGSLLAYMATWMGTVGASWLMAELDARPLMVALIQAANTVPYFLLSLPAGVLADVLDRRRVMLWMQTGNVLAAVVLAVLLGLDALHPMALLGLSFVFGAMLAVNAPAMQASVASTVSVQQLPQAVGLSSISYNMARSLGPALAGVVLALAGPVWLFVLVAGVYALAWGAMWRLPAVVPAVGPRDLPPEPLGLALRDGLRFAWHSPAVHAVLVRSLAITLCGSALWALLPLLAAGLEGGSAAGYGLLVTCLGGGAILGGLLLPALRNRYDFDRLIQGSTLVFAGMSALVAMLRQPWAVYPCLLVGGAAWLVGNSVLFTVVQIGVPQWVRARSTALALVTFQGGMAAGAVLWGAVAGPVGVHTALLLAAGLSVPWFWLNRRFPLPHADGQGLQSVQAAAEPVVPQTGPASPAPLEVEVRYRVPEVARAAFVAQAQELGASRRRNGAHQWRLLVALTDPGCYVERFEVASVEAWQHHVARTTRQDQALHDALQAWVEPGHEARAEHYVRVTQG